MGCRMAPRMGLAQTDGRRPEPLHPAPQIEEGDAA